MDLKGRFLASCRARGMSRKTIELYRLALSQLEDFGALSELDEAMVAEYLDRELDRNSRSTANTKLQVVRSFARWAVAAGELPARLLDQLPARVKHPAPEPRVATVEQLHTLLPELPLHHKVAVLLMGHAGLRISEVTGLTGKDVDLVLTCKIDRDVLCLPHYGKRGDISPPVRT